MSLKTVILDAMENDQHIEKTLIRLLKENTEEISYYRLKDRNIMPCRSCGSCGLKTPGRCILGDDMQDILKAIAKSERIIMLTPIRFGGYSSQLKKAVDRFMVLGLPLYIVKKGKLLHPMRYGTKTLIGIGITEKSMKGQEDNFRTIVERNALNMQSPYKTLIFKSTENDEKIEYGIRNALKEVN